MKLRIKSLREELSMTQQGLADKLFLTQKTINSYEVGRTRPNIETLCKLADIFDTSIDYLVGNSNVRYSSLIKEEEITNKEKYLLKNFRKLSEETQDHLLNIVLVCENTKEN